MYKVFMNKSIVFKLLFLVFCLCPIDGYAMMEMKRKFPRGTGSLSKQQIKILLRKPVGRRTAEDLALVREKSRKRQEHETSVIKQYGKLQPLKTPGYIYKYDRGRKRVGMKTVKIHTFIVKFKKKMSCVEFDGYHIRLNKIIKEAGRCSVYCCIKKSNFTELKLQVKDSISPKEFGLMIRKVNHLFKDIPPRHDDWQRKI